MNWDDLNGTTNYNPGTAYAQSKLANILHAKKLARNVKDLNISVYAVHPGVVVTSLFRHWMTSPIIRFLMPLAKPFMKSAWHGAQTTLYCILDDSIEMESGEYYDDCKNASPSSRAMCQESQDRLWQVSEKLSGLHH